MGTTTSHAPSDPMGYGEYRHGEHEVRARIVVDLGLGDAGKGLATDFFVGVSGADVVVRFNGGAQAGHNVVTADGRHHTFSQLGAGSFHPGVRTFLARDVVVHPTALLREAEILEAKGVPRPLERLAVSEHALLITPFHQAANRLRELARGDTRHGSVGVGVGEAVLGALIDPDGAVRASDLAAPARLLQKLARLRERLRTELQSKLELARPDVAREWAFFEDGHVAADWQDLAVAITPCVQPDDTLRRWLARTRGVVFEGAQGLLLDETLGFHPFTTWSDCTPRGALRLLAEAAPELEPEVIGVLRAHTVRHGPGPLPTEDRALDHLVQEHNREHAWQGRVRYGWFDALLARYAVALTPELDRLFVTHVDALAQRSDWRAAIAYDISTSSSSARTPAIRDAPEGDLQAAQPVDLTTLVAARGSRIRELVPQRQPSLERQARLGALLTSCQPIYEALPAHEAAHIESLEALLNRPIDFVSRGQTAAHVEVRRPPAVTH